MKIPYPRAAALLGLAGAAAAIIAFGGTAAAYSATYPLSPQSGSIATGSGSVSVDPLAVPAVATITLSGAHPYTTYQVAGCSYYMPVQPCASNGAADQFATDAFGNAYATVVLPQTTTLDYVIVTDIVLPNDSYQATVSQTGAYNPYAPTNPYSPYTPTYTTTPGVNLVPAPPDAMSGPNGLVLVPGGSTYSNGASALNVCPFGYVGPLVVNYYGNIVTVYCTGQ